MKVYSIGREVGCDIVINDNSDVISRRHATLNVAPSGKMTIVDLSHNGTYVNGIRIAQNVPVPVTRKDNVSFAHVARLDWNLIPNTGVTIMRWAFIGVLALLLIIGAIWGFSSLASGDSSANEQPTPVAIDSTELQKEKERIESLEKQKQDSIKKQVQDSLNKVKQKESNKRGKKTDKKEKETKKPEPKKEETTPKRVRG